MAFFKKIFSILADSLAKTLGHGFDFRLVQNMPTCVGVLSENGWHKIVVKIIRIQILVENNEPPLIQKLSSFFPR